jgi:hypothetical protein
MGSVRVINRPFKRHVWFLSFLKMRNINDPKMCNGAKGVMTGQYSSERGTFQIQHFRGGTCAEYPNTMLELLNLKR